MVIPGESGRMGTPVGQTGHNFPVPPLSDRLAELARITERAVDIALQSRRVLKMELKGDNSIVTNADRDVETFLRTELAAAWPNTGIWGEEFGRGEEGADGLWLIDPIDGTSNFAFGSQLWGISIALGKGDGIELGAVALPDLGELYLVERGQIPTCNREPLAPIPSGPIESHQLVSYNDTVARKYAGQPMPGKMRCSGAFVIDGAFVARQRFRGMIGVRERLYDAAASILICQELGADVRYANGDPLDIANLMAGKPFERAWLLFPADSGFRLTDPG